MFLKTTRSGKYEYVQVVESVWEDGKSVHKVRFNLGRKDAITNSPEWQTLARKLSVLAGLEDPKPRGKSLPNFSEGSVLNWGYVAYSKIWSSLGLDDEIASLQAKTKAEFSLTDAVFLMALHHLLSPGSKLNAFEKQERYASLPQVKLQNLYRALDFLCEYKDTLEESLFAKNFNLLNAQIDVVFYDVTTFAFQSVVADSLRDFGFSKDNKINEVQVVLGMFIDSDGNPLGYDLFSGNTFDGNTLVSALGTLQKRFGIRRVIIVADRGINSKLNLKSIKDAGYGYIVASRLKSMPNEIKELALETDGFQTLSADQDSGEVMMAVKRLDYINVIRDEQRREIDRLEELLLVTYSTRRAGKDASDRQRLLDKAKRLLENPSAIKGQLRRGGRKYIKSNHSSEPQYSLDEDALLRDSRWDGYYAIQSSEKEMSAQQILDAYHTLWKIEESFRIMKSTLEVRPIHHWTEPRIRGHFVVCFLAFLMERRLEQRLHSSQLSASPVEIRDALNALTVTHTDLDGVPLYLKSKVPSLAAKILRTLRIAQPDTVTSEESFRSWLSARR